MTGARSWPRQRWWSRRGASAVGSTAPATESCACRFLRLILVVGARPNLAKAQPLVRALASRSGVETILLHTGQHYDPALSQELFTDLQLRQPDRHLGVGSGSRSQQL